MLSGSIGVGPFDTEWLALALVLTAPILLAAIGELISERAGVLNVGLEGMMLSGAFFAYLLTWQTGSPVVGVLGGCAGGLLFGVVMSLLSVSAQADQIVAGVGINLAAFGLTAFLFDEVFGEREQILVSKIGNLAIPGFAQLPDFGDAIFNQDPLLYLSLLLVPASWFLLYRTKWGLSIRAAGELPSAADTSGVSVSRVRWMCVLTAAGLAGIAGAYLVVVDVGVFRQGMTAGRGFLALVAVIFGRWTPVGTLGACLILGAADALQLRLADQDQVPREVWAATAVIAVAIALVLVRSHRPSLRVPLALSVVVVSRVVLFAAEPAVSLPSQLWRALPFLLALAVLAAALTSARMPSHLTLPYRRGKG